MSTMYRLSLPVEFPSGICAGGASAGNEIPMERNGKKEPVLRGSAIAGRLRHAFSSCGQSFTAGIDLDKIFGTQPSGGEEDNNTGGCLIVEDAILDTGKGKTSYRTYHLRDRHKGRVVDKGLFAVEICPPGTQADLIFWLKPEICEEAHKFACLIRAFLERGMIFGGNGNRGIGLARLREKHKNGPVYHAYNLSELEGYAAWLDARDGNVAENQTVAIPILDIPENQLHICLELKIPEGQDIVVSYGPGETRQAEPGLTTGFDGRPYWEIPGSAFHGILRQWVTRLATREGYPVADHTTRYTPFQEIPGDQLGWCFEPENFKAHNNCMAARLFGSLHKAGRVHCTGAFALAGQELLEDLTQYKGVQERTHVAIDPISGGAVNQMLFTTAVLTSDCDKTFKTDWYIEMPDENEARWIAQTIMAVDTGLIRIGSAKASGRLKLIEPPQVSGPRAAMVCEIIKQEGGND